MTEETKRFEDEVGTWDGELEIRPEPGAEPQRSTGVMVNRFLGERWLVSDFKNTVTGFEGHGVYGWDAVKQSYAGTWVDPMRSTLVIGAGTWDASARTITYRYQLEHGGRTMRWRDVTEVIDANTRVFRSIVEVAPDRDHEVLTATYRRRP